MVTKNEFKQRSAELFKSGNPLTTDAMTTFADNITQLELGSGSGVKQITTDEKTKENKRIKIETSGDVTKINVAPWYNTFLSEFYGMFPSAGGFVTPKTSVVDVDFDYIKKNGLPVGGGGMTFVDGKPVPMKNGYLYRILLNGSRILYKLMWTFSDIKTWTVKGNEQVETGVSFENYSANNYFNGGMSTTFRVDSVGYNSVTLSCEMLSGDLQATRKVTMECQITTDPGGLQYDDTLEIGYGYNLIIRRMVIKDEGILNLSGNNQYGKIITYFK